MVMCTKQVQYYFIGFISRVLYPDSVWLQFGAEMDGIDIQINELGKKEKRKSKVWILSALIRTSLKQKSKQW